MNTPSGCAMYWSPVTAIRKKTPACWVKVLANTSRYNGWKYFPYHRLGVHKYEAMGWDYKLKEVKENTPEQLERAEKLFKEYFTNVITN